MELEEDLQFLERAIELAGMAERAGNLPVGAVIAIDGRIVAEGQSMIFRPHFHPGRHAEMEALRTVPHELWPRRAEMTCYTTLEPCIMCMSALILHGIGRVVFGATDTQGGGTYVLDNLPRFYAGGATVPTITGPLMPERCDALFNRAKELFGTRGEPPQSMQTAG
jgi:tRNA(adenine34) deaminase